MYNNSGTWATLPDLSDIPPSALASTIPTVLKSAIKKSKTNDIPINAIGLDLSCNPDPVVPNYNARPPSNSQSKTFIQISFFHDPEEDYEPSQSIIDRIKQIYDIMLEIDTTTTINSVWTQGKNYGDKM